MTPAQTAHYQDILFDRLIRLWSLRRHYDGQLNDLAERLFYHGYLSTLRECLDAGLTFGRMRPYLSFAPPPPAKPSPEGSP